MMRISILTLVVVVLGLAGGRAMIYAADVADMPLAAGAGQDDGGPQTQTISTSGTMDQGAAPAAAAPVLAEQPGETAAAAAAPAAASPDPAKPWSLPEASQLEATGDQAVRLAGTGLDLQLGKPREPMERAGRLQRPQQRV